MKIRQKLMRNFLCIIASGGVLHSEAVTDNRQSKGNVAAPAIKRAAHISADPLAKAQFSGEPARMVAKARRDLFAVKTWKPPPPPPVPPPPPPKPVAPPLPFTFSGSMRDATQTDDVILFLTQGNRNLVVRKGEVIGANYRLDEISGNVATFTYLPLQQIQRLAIGNTR